MLRHLTATLAYRAAKVLRDVPPGFGASSFGASARTPVRIVGHMGDLMEWAVSMTRGETVWNAGGGDDWQVEVDRFFAGIAALDAALAKDALPPGAADTLIQGPLADALTHVGQLAMLRGMADAPIRPESYARAEIVDGRVGPDQAAPGKEFSGDASVKR